MIFFSRKYADKAKADRAEAVAKARELCKDPSKYKKATSYGAAKYVKNLHMPQLIEAMNKTSCSLEDQNIYLLDYRSPVSDAIGEAIGADFKKRRLTFAQIKNILGSCKN